MAIIHWSVDPAHSEIQFKVKHLMISTVTGYFKSFQLEVDTEEKDFTKASGIIFTADIDSIETNNAQRDAHLKSGDFFAAEEFHKLRFEGRHFKKHDANYLLTGDLTIRDVTRPVEVLVEYNGTVKDPWGQERAGFTAEATINRKDFNLTWDAVTEAGQVVVSNQISIHCAIELVKQQAAAQESTEKKSTVEA